MFDSLSLGLFLGLSAGLAPGPLLTLVIAETLTNGTAAGVRVALAPLLTDAPLVLFTLFVLARLADYQPVLGVISLVGGGFLLVLGYENLRVRGLDLERTERRPRSLAKGILANLLSPSPSLFWFTIGAPATAKALGVSLAAGLGFLAAFYGALVGAKVLLAVAVGRSRACLSSRAYVYANRILGVMLCGLALGLLRDSLGLLGAWPSA
jgi:threonine/homoserine/homoserine lactone efflux protein